MTATLGGIHGANTNLRCGVATGHTWAMKVRVKLSGAPLAYTLAIVEGASDPYKAFGSAVWSKERSISLALREMLFLRTSIINQCPT